MTRQPGTKKNWPIFCATVYIIATSNRPAVFTVAVRQIIDNTDAERQQRNTELQVEMPTRTTINNTQSSMWPISTLHVTVQERQGT